MYIIEYPKYILLAIILGFIIGCVVRVLEEELPIYYVICLLIELLIGVAIDLFGYRIIVEKNKKKIIKQIAERMVERNKEMNVEDWMAHLDRIWGKELIKSLHREYLKHSFKNFHLYVDQILNRYKKNRKTKFRENIKKDVSFIPISDDLMAVLGRTYY